MTPTAQTPPPASLLLSRASACSSIWPAPVSMKRESTRPRSAGAGGAYRFNYSDPSGTRPLTPGATYEVGIVPPPGALFDPSSSDRSAATNPQPVTTSTNGSPAVLNLGLQVGTSISGMVFEDLNQSGQLEPGDPGEGGWKVYVDLNQDGQPDPDDPSAVTASDGSYQIYGLTPDTTYTLRLYQDPATQAGYFTTSPTAFTLTTGDNPDDVVSGLNFGVLAYATVSGTVGNYDMDGDNLSQETSPPPGGWEMQLLGIPSGTAIDAGGGAAGNYQADVVPSGTSYVASSTTPVNTSGLANPAPQAVYQSYRYGPSFSYAVEGLEPGAPYTVRLDFAELYFTKPGQRVFDVSINGQPVLTDFDVLQAAGGPDMAIAESFTATASASGTITISFNALVNNAEINGIAVTPQAPVAIDAGGGAAGIYQADSGAGWGGESQLAQPTTATINTSAVSDLAPQAVYQSNRFGQNFSYTVGGLAPGVAYTVRLDFAEGYFTQVGQRVFDVSINGQPVLTNFDIIAAAGGPDTAVAESFGAIAGTGGTITIAFQAVVNNAQINGIEVTPYGGFAIDAGGGAAGAYQADTGAGWSGASQVTTPTTAIINTSGVADPAPQTVYQTVRYGKNFTYTATGLAPGGIYNVRLDFAELYYANDQRRAFDVIINGQQVLTDFNVFDAAGGEDQAIAESFSITATASGTIAINFVAVPGPDGVTDNAEISGITISELGQVIAQTTASTKDGSYTFTDVPPGNDVVRQVVPSGWQQTSPLNSQLAFTQVATYSAVSDPISAVGADFNNDGLPDMADLDADGNYAIYLNQGNGTFSLFQQGNFNLGTDSGQGYQMLVINAPGTTGPSLAIVSNRGEVCLLLNEIGNGQGFVAVNDWVTVPHIDAGSLFGVATGVFTSNGLTDLVLCFHATFTNTSGFVVILANPTDYLKPTISSVYKLNVQGAVAVADMNGDGNEDIVINGGSGANVFTIYYGDGTGNFSSPQSFSLSPSNDLISGGSAGGVVVGDINGDGLPDVALVALYPQETSQGKENIQVVAVYDQTSAGGFVLQDLTGSPAVTTVTSISGVVLAQLSGGLDPDLATVGTPPGSVFVFPGGNPDEPYDPDSPVLSLSGSAEPTAVVAADIDNDGQQDLIVADKDGGLRVYMNQSVENLTLPVMLEPGESSSGNDFTNAQATAQIYGSISKKRGVSLYMPTNDGGDSWTLVRNGAYLDVVNAGTDVVLDRYPLNQLYSITVYGSNFDADSLTVDERSGGGFTLPGGITFDGGADGNVPGSTVEFLLGDRANTVNVAGTSATINGLGVSWTNIAGLAVGGGTGNDSFTLSGTPLARGVIDLTGGTGSNTFVLATVNSAARHHPRQRAERSRFQPGDGGRSSKPGARQWPDAVDRRRQQHPGAPGSDRGAHGLALLRRARRRQCHDADPRSGYQRHAHRRFGQHHSDWRPRQERADRWARSRRVDRRHGPQHHPQRCTGSPWQHPGCRQHALRRQ